MLFVATLPSTTCQFRGRILDTYPPTPRLVILSSSELISTAISRRTGTLRLHAGSSNYAGVDPTATAAIPTIRSTLHIAACAQCWRSLHTSPKISFLPPDTTKLRNFEPFIEQSKGERPSCTYHFSQAHVAPCTCRLSLAQ